MKRIIDSIVLLLLGGSVLNAADRPNIVVIVADDLGWADVGYHDSELSTPNIDRYCREGLELNQHYVAPMCTPTRTALLTGRYWSRFGNTAPSNTQVLPFDTVTLATALDSLGYHTGITGKWHLGSLPKWGPTLFGFDHSHGSLAGGVGPWNHLYKRGEYSRTWHRNDKFIEQEGHVTDLITAEAVQFINKDRDSPYFLYVPFTAVHHPLAEPNEWLNRNQQIASDRRQYAACVMHLDDSVGKIFEAIETSGQQENTLVVFFSDNGGMDQIADRDNGNYPGKYPEGQILGLNHPLRGRKGQVYEGGIRVPAFVHWPARLTPGKVDTPMHVIDWMPTICRLAGYQSAKSLKWDGVDVWPTLTRSNRDSTPREFYWKGVRGQSYAIRQGDWKLVVHKGESDRVELFDLRTDPNEQQDVANSSPNRVRQMQEQLQRQMSRDDDAVPQG